VLHRNGPLKNYVRNIWGLIKVGGFANPPTTLIIMLLLYSPQHVKYYLAGHEVYLPHNQPSIVHDMVRLYNSNNHLLVPIHLYRTPLYIESLVSLAVMRGM
jgi:hypothetical protein